MCLRIRIAIIATVIASVCFAQEPPLPGGLLFEDDAYNALPRQSAEDGSKADLPQAADLSSYCPEVRHQGYIFSCVGWATGYGAMTIQRAVLNQCTDRGTITRNAYSALFLYNQIKDGDCQKGSRISDALNFLTENGDCLARQFDFNVNECEKLPDDQLRSHARRFAIEDFVALFGSQDAADLKIRQVKKMLSQKRPVIVGMSVLRNFYNLKNAKYWHPNIGDTGAAGGHALVAIGYDDTKEAFRLFNSWGKDWGDNGFIWVKYKDFADFCKYGFVLYLLSPPDIRGDSLATTVPERPLLQMAGNFEFRHFTGYDEFSGQPQFQPAVVKLSEGTYRTDSEWAVGQLFQLLATTLKAEEYLYIFSVDAQREVHFHWPRQQGLNEKFKGANESGLVMSGGSQIIIPGENKVLKIAHPGADHLVVLFSKKRINNVRALADRLARSDGNLFKNLRSALGNAAVPATDITYTANRIGFEAVTRSDGFIVPLVLEVMAK